ncbi:MAG: ATP-binding protein [Defluviitaleaceae bacterium]|nr:ATP-binding protein [Defluviitaleaceae bacterium]
MKKWFKNLEIGKKLRVYSVVIVVLVMSLVLGVSFSMVNMLRNFGYLENYPRHRAQLAGHINSHFMNIQQYLSRMSVYAGFPAEIETQEQLRLNILAEIDEVSIYFGYFMESIESDPRLSYAQRNYHRRQLYDAMSHFELWEALVVSPVITANIAGNRERVVALYNWHTYFYDQLIIAFSAMQKEASAAVDEGTAEVYTAAIIAIAIFVLLSITVVILCISFPVFTLRLEGERAANKAKSVFLANMSHEIRTPISAVLGISEIQLQNTTIKPEILESFANIHNSAKLLLGIINDILDFSKLEDDKMVLLQEEYETENMIGYVSSLHPTYLGDKDIAFVLKIDENMPLLFCGDPLRIEQIVINLLSNAFKYTKSGVVELSWKIEDVNVLVICVKDTGMGMTKEQIKIIHEEYTRFHENESKNIQGTGLGMSIVYRLVRLMNATIEIDSEPDNGTSVTVRIPQKTVCEAVLGKERVRKLQRFEMQNTKSGFGFVPEPMPYGSVLVVDDIETNLFVVQGLLAFYELNIETCTSGKDAIDKIRDGKAYDIVFMDYMMPEMNGMEATRIIRGMGYTRPIIAFTANSLIDQNKEYAESGFDGYLLKPIIVKNLNTLLLMHIKNKQSPETIADAQRRKTTREMGDNGFSGGDKLQTRIRRDFATNHKNLFVELKDAINAGDIGTAHRLAHTLKGLAALMKEDALIQAASKAEDLLGEGIFPTQSELDIIEIETRNVLDGISLDEAERPPVSRADTVVLLKTLKPMLEQRKTTSLKLVDQLMQIPETLLIAKQIQQFRFPDALVGVNLLLEELDDN